MLSLVFYSPRGDTLLIAPLSAAEATDKDLIGRVMERVRLGQTVAFDLEKISFSFAAGVVGYAIRNKESSK